MTRDYANRSSYNGNGVGRGTILIIGIVLGAVLAATVYSLLIHQAWWHRAEEHVVHIKETVTNRKIAKKSNTVKPTHSKKVSVEDTSKEPHFDFYTELPKLEVLVAEEGIKKTKSKAAEVPLENISGKSNHVNRKKVMSKTIVIDGLANTREDLSTHTDPADVAADMIKTSEMTSVSTLHGFIVQVASFADFAEADHLKAQLALMGFDVKVRAVGANSEQRFRVMIGPFNNEKHALAAQRELRQNHFNSLIIRT